MLSFLIRRGVIGIATMFVALFIMFPLVNAAADPLSDLREYSGPDKAQRIAARIEQLDLDTNVIIRFFKWIGNVFTGDLGVAWRTGRSVNDQIVSAMGSTLQLVTAATFLALFLGVAVGVVSALRQYSTFDYLMIFVSFLLFSLPAFWVAVLLKQWVALGYNDFLADAVIPWPVIIGLAIVSGLLWTIAVGGRLRQRLTTFGVAAVATGGVLAYLQLADWFNNPTIGIVGVAVIGAAIAVAAVGIFAGLRNRRALLTGLTTVAIGVALYYPVEALFGIAAFRTNGSVTASLIVAGLGVVAVIVGVVVGLLYGGPDRGTSMRLGGVIAFVTAALIFVDQVMQVWVPYARYLKGRPIPTTGDRTPNMGGDYWVGVLDSYTHLVLPTITLILVGFAAYTRYSRGSMLEAMNQDYVRTARAKGLPERVVIVRHAFRNTLIPLATIVPVDIITLIGGAVITETIFGRPGMGQLFVNSLSGAEPDPVMAYLLITAFLAILANIIADIVYAAVDPRIRLEA